jgi:hypothetical protein
MIGGLRGHHGYDQGQVGAGHGRVERFGVEFAALLAEQQANLVLVARRTDRMERRSSVIAEIRNKTIVFVNRLTPRRMQRLLMQRVMSARA